MKKRILSLLLLIIIIGISIGLKGGVNFIGKTSTARAVGDLIIDWGVPEGNPIFVVNNMAPGDSETRSAVVNNNSSYGRKIGLRGILVSESKNFSEVLDLEIIENGNKIYGPVKLSQFFIESNGPMGIPLFIINASSSKTINFILTFNQDTDNNYQEASIVFDLIIGLNFEIPAQCSGIDFSKGEVIFGTEGNDNLRGTSGNDLIFGLEGNDTLEGGNNNDCLIGGTGNDKLFGSNGNDVILGNEGNDIIDGGNGTDQIWGGKGEDKIKAGNGMETDTIYGEEGGDTIYGSNGKDSIYGGDGKDMIYGENGDDYIEGGNDDDKLFGGNGNDILVGNQGNDTADGGLGKDRCQAKSTKNCEL